MRERIAAQRKSLAPADRRAAGAAIEARLRALPEFVRAERVAAYVALADEVPLDDLVDSLRAAGRLVLPRVRGRDLVFLAVRDLGTLRRGRLGVLEPSEAETPVRLGTSDLMLVPGTAFDAAGARLGRGMGFYDRALGLHGERPFAVGVAFAFQVVQRVPMLDHDRCVDAVVTERALHRRVARDRVSDPG